MTIPAWEALAGEKSPDQAWLDTVALLVLDAATGPVGSAELRQLRSRIADLALAGGPVGSPPGFDGSLRLLVAQLDATIERRRAQDLKVEPGSRRAHVIAALRNAGGASFSDQLTQATGMAAEHVSRACGELQAAGLLLRRTFGRRVEWTLTPLADTVRTELPADQLAARPEGLRLQLSRERSAHRRTKQEAAQLAARVRELEAGARAAEKDALERMPNGEKVFVTATVVEDRGLKAAADYLIIAKGATRRHLPKA